MRSLATRTTGRFDSCSRRPTVRRSIFSNASRTRADMKTLNALLSVFLAASAGAQTAADGPVLGAKPARATTAFKIWLPAGSLRLVGWDRDSIHVRGRVPKGE